MLELGLHSAKISLLTRLVFVSCRVLIEGTKILNYLENLPTFNERPKVDCRVADCGAFKCGKSAWYLHIFPVFSWIKIYFSMFVVLCVRDGTVKPSRILGFTMQRRDKIGISWYSLCRVLPPQPGSFILIGRRWIQGRLKGLSPPKFFSDTFFDRCFPAQKCPLGWFFCVAFK